MATFHDRTLAPKFQPGLLRSAGSPCRVLTSAELVDLLSSDDTPAPTGLVPAHDTLATVEAEFGHLVAQPWPGTISVQSDPKADVPSDGGCCDIETPSVRHGRACHDTVAVGVRCGGITTPDVPHGAARGPTAPIAGPLPSLGGRTHTCTVNRADIGTDSGSADRCAMPTVQIQHRDGFGLPKSGDLKIPTVGDLPAHQSVHLVDTLAQARTLHARRALARTCVAAYDAGKFKCGLNLAPLPNLTSAFAKRREIFGAFDGEND